ncbi:WD40 repeat domain-containing protein [Hyalangium gracile]|uniref:WD40 repeat domain-containing protein n=1 Tax=Hyalangium gracile TaxID=394092 RepID=UPI001CCA324F|nr:hypothetical protein [Hyalangium gracile]
MNSQVLSPRNAERLVQLRSLGPGGPPWPRGQKLRFSMDSQWLVSIRISGPERLRWWRLSAEGPFPVASVPFDRGGDAVMLAGAERVLSTSSPGLLQEWAAGDGSLLRESSLKGLAGLSLSADSKKLLLTSGEGKVWLWDVARWQAVRELEASPLQIYEGALSPDGRWAVAGAGNRYVDEPVTLRVWDVETGALHREVPLPLPCAWSVAFHPTQPLVVVGGPPNELLVVDTTRWEQVRHLESVGTDSVSFSPDGGLLVAGGTGFSVLDFHRGQVIYQHTDEEDEQSSHAVMSPDGRLLAWGQGDGTVGLWGVE